VDHRTRRERLTERYEELGIDALLVTNLTNVRYLSGFTGSSAMALVAPVDPLFLTDGRYGEQARNEVPDMVRVASMDGLTEPVRDHCRRLGISRLGFEREDVTVAQHARWTAALEGIELIGIGPEVARLRRMKDPEELAMLRAAQEATDATFADVLDVLVVGVTERRVATQLEREITRDGADGLAFDPIVAFGEHAAEPHHRPCHRVLAEGDMVTMDFGALVGGYHTDMTRTVAFGDPTAQLRKVYDVVGQAQQAGIDAVRADAVAGDVDRAARTVIEDAGYGDQFSHGLGHGVGLEIHEGPWLRKGGDDVLPERAVVTVEPGIYLPGIGGVRIEDAVEVTEDGARPLGSSTRDLIEL
jgi:Xaa-Pro aminopeptidase